jgi:hypothetical protein
MLGCHDFCGYYEWTFHYLRRRFGVAALKEYWANAIAADSQQHYLDAAREEGLRGLYKSWAQTGEDEECDWTVTLDEPNNLLRLDMRECPSKGFLLQNDLNADEDYCDHCIGWIGPALHQIGAEVVAHEHNHCGQCWWEMRMVGKDQPPVDVAVDIRRDARWQNGYLDRFSHHEKLPVVGSDSALDSVALLRQWFATATQIVALDVGTPLPTIGPNTALVASGRRFAAGDLPTEQVRGIVLEHDPDLLAAVARQYHASSNPPLLMHAYLPQQPRLNFASHELPRAVPLLPLLIHTGVYRHAPGQQKPAFPELAAMLAAALQKDIVTTLPFQATPST